MKLSQIIAPLGFAITTGLTATSATAQATACIGDQCVTGSSSASIRQDGTYISRNGVNSGNVLQPVQPYRHQPIQPALSYRPQPDAEPVRAQKPVIDVYSFPLSLHGQKETWICKKEISNAATHRDMKTDCTATQNATKNYSYNIIPNPYKLVTATSTRNVFCASASGAATYASMSFDQTVYNPGEPIICIQFKRDIR